MHYKHKRKCQRCLGQIAINTKRLRLSFTKSGFWNLKAGKVDKQNEQVFYYQRKFPNPKDHQCVCVFGGRALNI